MASDSPYNISTATSPTERKRAAVAVVLMLILFGALAFVAPHDPTKVVSGLPCSVLSEEQIGEVLGTPMRLMPASSTGTVCRYVPTSSTGAHSLFVIARHASDRPTLAVAGTPLPGIGDEAIAGTDATYVRYGRHWYAFILVPRAADDRTAPALEQRLATMMHRPMIARGP
ncbi:MAG TPA: hypothetical protein VGD01_12945 [Candidatus Elarobacter sp.]|jgi:hypothetical protein